jgi:hypothetical protein
MKKILSVIMVVAVIFSATVTSYAADTEEAGKASSDIVASVSNKEVKAGDTVIFTLDVAKTTDGIAGIEGTVTWNEEQLTYVDKTVGKDYTTLNFNDDKTSSSFGKFSVYGSNYVTAGTTAFTLTFTANSNLEENQAIDINVTGLQAVYENAGTVELKDQKISLTVVSSKEAAKDDAKEPAEEEASKTPTEQQQQTVAKEESTADDTVATTSLPKTGATATAIFAVCLVAVIAIVPGKKYIQYLKDTHKQI